MLIDSIPYQDDRFPLGVLTDYFAYSSTGAVSAAAGCTLTTNNRIVAIGSETGAITGFSTPPYTVHTEQSIVQFCTADSVILSNAILAMVPTVFSPAAIALANQTVLPGTYSYTGAVSVNGVLTFDALGDSNAIFIILSQGALSVAANVTMVLINNAIPEHIFWVMGGAVGVGADSIAYGTYITNTTGAISIGANCSITGRLFAMNGAIAIGASTSIAVR